MKSQLLFPSIFKLIGVILLLPGLIFGYLFEFQGYVPSFLRYGTNRGWEGADNFTDELVITFIVTGLLFIGFSKIKNESDTTVRLRLNALYWAVLVNCVLVITYFAFGLLGELFQISFIKKTADVGAYFIKYNFLIPLPIFISRFYFLLYRSKQKRKSSQLYFINYGPYTLIGKIIAMPFITFAISAVILSAMSIGTVGGIGVMYGALASLPFLLFWIWSKEKNEIAIIRNTRLKAMQVAVCINYFLFLACTWVIYGSDYLIAMSTCIISIQIIFLFVFYYKLYRLKNKRSENLIT